MAINGKHISEYLDNHSGHNRNQISEGSGIPYNNLKRRCISGRGWELDELQLIADFLGFESVAEFLKAVTNSTEQEMAA